MSDTPRAFEIRAADGVDVRIDDSPSGDTFDVTVVKDGAEVEMHRGITADSIVRLGSAHFTAIPVPPSTPAGAPTLPTVPPAPSVPPPPGDSAPPAPPTAAIEPPAYSDPGYGAPFAPGYGPAPGFTEKPPRPDVKIGAALIVAGAVIAIIAVYLPWLTGGVTDLTGTGFFISTDPNTGQLTTFDGPGTAIIAVSVVLAGLGIALFFAGRVLAVAIIAIVVSAIAVLVGIFMISLASDTRDFNGGELGIGVILQPIAPLAALAGSIVATAKRRR